MGKTKIKLLDDSQPIEQKKEKLNKMGKKEYSISNPILEEFQTEDETEEKKADTLKEKSTQQPKRVEKTASKSGKSKVRSKKYQQAIEDVDRGSFYQIPEAIELAKKSSYSKFIGSLDIHINTKGTDIRGLVSLPFIAGKKPRILVFGKGASESGADLIGDDEVIGQIIKGKIDFDILVTTPEWMPKLAKAAKVLGPKGLMPNPKNGTIADDLKKAVASFQTGKTEYKTESKAAIIHLGLGKLNQPTEELSENIKTLLQAVGKSRVKKAVVTPTMGPSFKLDTSIL